MKLGASDEQATLNINKQRDGILDGIEKSNHDEVY